MPFSVKAAIIRANDKSNISKLAEKHICFVMLCVALRNLVPFVQFKKREKTHGGVLLLVKSK